MSVRDTMGERRLADGALVSACMVFAALGGCSGNQTNGNQSSGDAGVIADASRADATADGSTATGASDDAGIDSPPPGDGPVVCNTPGTPQGTQILASATAVVQGVTSDGQVLYYDSATQHLGAVPADGGSPVDVGPWDQGGGNWGAVYTSRNVALYWNGDDAGAGQLWAWTRANGAGALGTGATWIGPPTNLGTSPFIAQTAGAGIATVDVSADGAFVAYFDGAGENDAGLSVGDIYVSGSDGSNPTLLVPGWVQTYCSPMVAFIGGYLVVSYATELPGGSGALNGTVAAFGPAPNWQNVQTLTTTSTCLFAGNVAGTQVSYADSGGTYVQTLGATSPPTLIDPLGAGGLFTNDGNSLIYLRGDGSVWRSPVSSPAPVELTAGPFNQIVALSSNDAWLELTPNAPFSDGNALSGLSLVSAAPGDGGNGVTALTDASVAGNLMEAIPAIGLAASESSAGAFTADNSQAVFFDAPHRARPDNLKHLGLPPQGLPATISQTFWGGYPTSGAKVVYGDNVAFVRQDGAYWVNGYANVHSVDLSVTAAPTALVSGADANFYLTADRKTLVYSWNYCSGMTGGIYTLPVP
jgi:hypothetical protein